MFHTEQGLKTVGNIVLCTTKYAQQNGMPFLTAFLESLDNVNVV